MTGLLAWRDSGIRRAFLGWFPAKAAGAPKRVEYASLDMQGLDTFERRRLVELLIEFLTSADGSAELLIRGKKDSRPTGAAAVEEFADSVDADLWRGGGVALKLLLPDETAVVLSPEGRGEMLDLVSWGPRGAALLDELIDIVRF